MNKFLSFITLGALLVPSISQAQVKLIGIENTRNNTVEGREDYKFIGAVRDFTPLVGTDIFTEGYGPKRHLGDSLFYEYNNTRELSQVVTYDAQNRPVEIKFYNNNNNWGTQTFQYHSNGNLAVDYFNYFERYVDSITYHEDGRTNRALHYFHSDTTGYLTIYKYNTSNQLVTLYSEPYGWSTSVNRGFDSTHYFYANTSTFRADSTFQYNKLNTPTVSNPFELKQKSYYTYNSAGDTLLDSTYYFGMYPSYGLSFYDYKPDTTSVKSTDSYNLNDTFLRFTTHYALPNSNERVQGTFSFYTQNDTLRINNAYANVLNSDDHLTKIITYELDANSNLVADTSIRIYRNADKNIDYVISTYGNDTYKTTYIYQDNQNTGVKAVIASNQVNVYPNPSRGLFEIKVENIEKYDVALYNAAGQLLGYYNNPQQIDITMRPAGNYILHFTDVNTKQSVMKQIVKR